MRRLPDQSLGTEAKHTDRPDSTAPFALPQFGIFAQGTHAHHFLEFDLKPGVEPALAVSAFRGLGTPDVSAGGVNLVLAFGAAMWRAVAPAKGPAGLAHFEPVAGSDGHAAPATQHDAWLWISSAEPGVTWESARAAALAVEHAALLAAEQQGFTYRGGRDITGFVDGTANPQVRRAADVAIIPPGRPGAGGSHVLAMRWVHDLVAFNRLTVGEQERVIGRTKADSVELSASGKPPTAHISRVQTTVAGKELEIFRRSVPYGTAAEHGLYFVAFSADRSRYDRMLARMFGNAPDAVRDRLTDFSRPVSGAYYFAPSLNALNELAGPE
jgi:putative iron-dependent peroxidase